MITKIQKLSAIHNTYIDPSKFNYVVYDYKDTKIVSNSQRELQALSQMARCL